MKAIIKGTNIEVEVQPFYSDRKFVGFSDKDFPGHCTYTKEDLIFPDAADCTNVDWSSFRREAAKDILCTLIGRDDGFVYMQDKRAGEIEVSNAICFADELIKQLKQE